MSPDSDEEQLAIPPANPEELARARRHRKILIFSMALFILFPLGAVVWLLLR